MLELDRRVLCNLSEPASCHHLVTVLMKDPHSPFDVTEGFASVEEDVAKVLDKLVRRQLVVPLGQHPDSKSMLRAVRETTEALDVPKAKAESLAERIDARRDIRLRTGELYIMSKAGFEALHAALEEVA